MLRFGRPSGKPDPKEHGSKAGARRAPGINGTMAKPWFIKVILLLRVVTLASALVSGLTNGWEVLVEVMPAAEVALRCYGALFSALVWCCEFELAAFLRNFLAFESWLLRGLFYVFLGVLGFVTNHEVDVATSAAMGNNFSKLHKSKRYGAIGMCLSGVLYFVLGLLCFSRLRERHLARIRERELLASEVGNLAQQKDEIERLLAETEGKLEKL